jgi:hypothetical protein
LSLPIFGEISITLPDFKPPQTNIVEIKDLKTEMKDHELTNKIAPAISGVSLGKSPKHLVTFLSSWSPQAMEQISLLNDASQDLGEGKAITGVFLQDSEGETTALMKRGGYSFEAISDKNGFSGQAYQINTLPQHFFVKDGIVQEVINGVLTSQEIIEKLDQLD